MTDHSADLIPISTSTVNNQPTLTCDARNLHAFLGVKRDFSSWIKGRIKEYGFIGGTDFIVFTNSGENPSGGRPTLDYTTTLDMAKELAMVEKTEKGRQVRRYFIECERRAREAAQGPPQKAVKPPKPKRKALPTPEPKALPQPRLLNPNPELRPKIRALYEKLERLYRLYDHPIHEEISSLCFEVSGDTNKLMHELERISRFEDYFFVFQKFEMHAVSPSSTRFAITSEVIRLKSLLKFANSQLAA